MAERNIPVGHLESHAGQVGQARQEGGGQVLDEGDVECGDGGDGGDGQREPYCP